MTSKIIYHDFQQTNPPESATVLTARVLVRGRRWHKFWNSIKRAADTTCLAACGACIAVSVAILCHIFLF